MIDPNFRPDFIEDEGRYRKRLGAMLRKSDIVKVSDEDLNRIEPAPLLQGEKVGCLLDSGPAHCQCDLRWRWGNGICAGQFRSACVSQSCPDRRYRRCWRHIQCRSAGQAVQIGSPSKACATGNGRRSRPASPVLRNPCCSSHRISCRCKPSLGTEAGLF